NQPVRSVFKTIPARTSIPRAQFTALVPSARALTIQLSHNLNKGKSWQQPSRRIRVLEFLRKVVFDQHTNLETFRAGEEESDAYVEELLLPIFKRGSFIEPWKTARWRELVQLCENEVQQLFRPDVALPYQLHHCRFKGQYYGIGLYVNRDISTPVLAEIIRANESTNCEMFWSKAARRNHDSTYTHRWRETGCEARKGWWWKYRLVKGGKKNVLPPFNRMIDLKARFGLCGHLMFANHDVRAPFLFNKLKPVVPLSNQQRITATMTLGVQKTDDMILPKDYQIFVYYGKHILFNGHPPVRFLLDDEEVEMAQSDGVTGSWQRFS
ncbi:hypothetical protein NCC49_004077, partial [Naganishia albida]